MSESLRLTEDSSRVANWKRWGPYLSDRQWGTVREDYSADGSCWDYFPHDHARSRAYRWGEDGLLGICDRECRLCFSLALWNGKDPILKERLFGLSGPEGNHGEDVKEHYYYIDSSPTHSYMKALYRYPQTEFPYAHLLSENRKRQGALPEYELEDTGIFADNKFFDVTVEYAKLTPNDIGIKVTIKNQAANSASIQVLPTAWFRNNWCWGRSGEGYAPRPEIRLIEQGKIEAEHRTLGRFFLRGSGSPTTLFTENETNYLRLFNGMNTTPYVKDAFHRYIINNEKDAINPKNIGTKSAFQYCLDLKPGESQSILLRLCSADEFKSEPLDSSFEKHFELRRKETDDYYNAQLPHGASSEERNVMRQAYAGLLWSKQFYYYSVKEWLEGDPTQPAPAESRWNIRNTEWLHLYNRDIISMPDKWEYPWYAAWDLAFHMIPFAKIDPDFAKQQLILFLREWYMHPNGQIPAYEFAFSDVNPPVHAWACWRVYKMTAPKGQRDRVFLARVFQKLLLNFTWWVNRKDLHGKNLFSGGFLGLDNIGVFDRSRPLPTGGHLEQADGTAWMAFYCATMLSMALELAKDDPAYEDLASKFFEHFISIADAINNLGGSGLWDPQDGFYYDQLHSSGNSVKLKVRSLVGLIPLVAVTVLEEDVIDHLPGFKKRMQWFIEHRGDLAKQISYLEHSERSHRLLALVSKDKLTQLLRYLLDENEFLSPYGIRSLSKMHQRNPYVFKVDHSEYRVEYAPGESNTSLFGGNSNWRGPVWLPLNYLLIEALESYHFFYGDQFKIEYPTASGNLMTLKEIAHHIAARLNSLFLPNQSGLRPFLGDSPVLTNNPLWSDKLLFHEYFHGDTGKGLGASHQTGWTALITRCIEKVAADR